MVRIGHRGVAALAPENSLRSLALAAEVGLDIVEFDVLRAGNGGLVLAHDARALARATPTLDDALELLRRLDVGLHLDLKIAGDEQRVVDALRRHGVVGRTYVSSVSLRVLRAIRDVEPALARAISYPDDRLGISRRRGTSRLVDPAAQTLRRALPYRIARWIAMTGASVASVHWRVVSRRLVDRCHALGVAVYAWTVNDAAVARTLVETGLDGIITDDPRIFDGL